MVSVSRTLLVTVVLLAWAAPAQAKETTVAKYRGFTLHAEERGNQVCMTLRRERRYQGTQCGRIPRSPHRPVSINPDVGWNNYAAAIAGSIRTAEIEYANGRRQRVPTFGRRGFTARFVILPASPPTAKFIRFFGARGELLGIDGGPAGYIDIFANQVQLIGDRDAGVTANTEVRLEASPDQPDRLVNHACVHVTTSIGGNGFCDYDSENGVIVRGNCDGPNFVGAVVAAGVAGVRLRLGGGSELVLPARDLPAVFGGRRAVAAEVPAAEAVVAAAAVDAGGQAVARATIGLAPGGQPCAGEDRGDDDVSAPLVPVAAPPAVAVAGELVAGDQGERLCVGLRRLPAHTCAPPPVDSDRPRLLRAGELVGGALSRDADRITLRLDRGAPVTVRATAGAYGGVWAGRVRFFIARVPAEAEVVGATVRNAAGTVIGISDRGVPSPRQTSRVLVERGGIGLQLIRREGDEPCVTALPGPAPRYCTVRNPGTPIDGPIRRYSATIVVTCAPRAAIAYGRIADEQRLPEVLLEGGGVVRATRIPLADEDAWIAYLPDTRVLGLRAAGDEAVSLNLPPASTQCGYSASRSF